ncbi:MAG TPA: peptidoglycan-binding protein [Archangium sp.]|uniref:peptidoglycan-binding protein n=1 Tax=Archangium sp. TaxID=1872627 RepID=UPI002E3264A0|nr:peptidoglycan-binding protein [Archangium sp.]HEX5748891.1 peptidoglycan-binding protein [Archangium sp.]
MAFILKRGSRGREVKTLQHWFSHLQQPPPALDALGTFGPQTEATVKQFQAAHRISPANGVVGASTWAALGNVIGTYIWLKESGAAESLARLGTDLAQGSLTFRHDRFMSDYMGTYGILDDSAAHGLSMLLRFIDRDPQISDVRWAAYMLATVKHECADTWQPIEEYGQGAGYAYGNPVNVVGSDGQNYSNVYYGRGYVQLTWKKNYKTMSDILYGDDRLVIHPELVLEPDVAYKIMSYGMRNGSFTSRSLGDYIKDNNCNYVNARRIINGTDEATRIATYARELERMLKASSYGPSK